MLAERKAFIRVRVRFFGPAKDLTNLSEVELLLPLGASVAEALERVVTTFPNLQEHLSRYRIAVNADYADEHTPLQEGDEVALIPPVSGGGGEGAEKTTEAVWVQLTLCPLDLSSLLNFVSAPEAGAVVAFIGTVRRFSHEKVVEALHYEAYEPMALKELEGIAEEMRRRWNLCKVAIAHRLGQLSLGEAAVAIFVSAPHRTEAFEAARYAIERLKEIVPIWKREIFADGDRAWVEGSPVKVLQNDC